jgi:hypothetical protein
MDGGKMKARRLSLDRATRRELLHQLMSAQLRVHDLDLDRVAGARRPGAGALDMAQVKRAKWRKSSFCATSISKWRKYVTYFYTDIISADGDKVSLFYGASPVLAPCLRHILVPCPKRFPTSS